MKRKHYYLILAWANGAEIEYLDGKTWIDMTVPKWYEEVEYRIKPESKPDIVLYANVQNADIRQYGILSNANTLLCIKSYGLEPNMKITYDGNTNEPKAVELI